MVSDNILYPNYPKDNSFVTFADEHGERLLFHGYCGQPAFVTNEIVLIVGCGKIETLNLHGTILKESTVSGRAIFAGISQNGKRAAFEFSYDKGDPAIHLYEYFDIFDVATLQPIAMVRISKMPERQSWSAFSHDGQYFVAGSPDALSLYHLP